MKISFFGLILLYLSVISPLIYSSAKKDIQDISFTSCIWHYDESLWQDISEVVTEKVKPDVFIFLGDTVYNDISETGRYTLVDYAYQRLPFFNYEKWFFKKKFSHNLLTQFARFQSTYFYQTLSHHMLQRSSTFTLPQNDGGIPGILAVWDDHDYGYNDSGSWHPEKIEVKHIFESMFGKAPNTTLTSNEPGIYGAYRSGPNNDLQIILLDCRSFKTPHFEIRKNPSVNVQILGEKQWNWLQERLSEPAKIRIIGSSFPVLPEKIFKWKNDQWKEQNKERWSIFGSERHRLLELLSQSDSEIILISGDWHFADLSRINYKGKIIHEVTAGGWHSNKKGYKGYKGLRKRFKHEYSIPSIQKDIPPRAWQNFANIHIDWSKHLLHLAIYNKLGEIEPGYEVHIDFN
ncbi:MAG: alkaline phosphatase D family protein [bacterium]